MKSMNLKAISEKSMIGMWSYPFVFNGCYLNWSEWGDDLPDYDLEASIHAKIKTLFEIKEINDPRTREDKIADMNRNGYF